MRLNNHLKGTIDVGLTFDEVKLCGSTVDCVDLDYAEDLDKMRSLTDYIFTISASTISQKVTL